MTLEEAFRKINLLDMKPSHRKFGPQWATVAVDSDGAIIDVIQHKEPPTPELHRIHMDLHPRSVQFTTSPGDFKTLQELREKIEWCIEVHKRF